MVANYLPGFKNLLNKNNKKEIEGIMT